MESNYFIYLLEAAVLTVICGWVGIPLLKKLKARQSIRTEGPKSHRAKSGTPTMGGLFMLTAMVLVVLFIGPLASFPDAGAWAFRISR